MLFFLKRHAIVARLLQFSKFRKTSKDLLQLIATCIMQRMKMFFVLFIRFFKNVLKESPICINFFDFGVIASYSQFKGNAQFVQKVTFEPLTDFKQNHYGSWKYYKSCYESFGTVLFNIFMRQTLTDDFWGLHNNMN